MMLLLLASTSHRFNTREINCFFCDDGLEEADGNK